MAGGMFCDTRTGADYPLRGTFGMNKFFAASCLSRLGCAVRRFGRNEEGALIVFGLIMFILMIAIGGLAVDVMRHESLRTRLQSTTDRAVLAAASLDQTLDPVAVVDDYFAKANMSSMLVSRTSETKLGFRHVEARTAAIQTNLFMDMIGIPTLNVASSGAAEESISTIEVSLVLDVSNSMKDNNRLVNLRVAGQDFIDELMGGDDTEDISVSVVPYSGQVNAGSTLLSYYNVSNEHGYSNCVHFAADDFDSTALSTAQPFRRAAHFDPWYTASDPQLMFCNTDARLTILPFSNDKSVLKNKIKNLILDGNTSIDIGVKWGAALLDPGTRPVIADLAANGIVPAALADRPFGYDNKQVLKVMVVMSDGENWDQFGIAEDYRSGPSNVWINTADNRPSIWHASVGKYYVRHLNTWKNDPWGSPVTTTNCTTSKGKTTCTTTTTPDTAERLTYPELWNKYTVRWVANNLYGDAFGSTSVYYTWVNNFLTVTQPSTKNTRLHNICQASKDAGVLIFSIGFEAPSNGRTALRDCASSPGHYYDAKGIELSSVFEAIARQITQLKLTQ
ncbi:Flp pilus assembly protein TadG [Rhodobacteraceae bacterium MBR-64]